MGEFIILLVTFISLIVLSVRGRKREKTFFRAILNLVRGINAAYKNIFFEKSILYRVIQIILICVGEFTSFITIYTGVIRHIIINFGNEFLEMGLKVMIVLVSFIIVHYAIGYILYVSLKIQGFIIKVENKDLKIDFLISYFLISSYLAVLFVFPDAFRENTFIGLLGMVICYCLNMKTLINLMFNPINIKDKESDEHLFKRIIVASMLILFMIILNLYLMVCLVNGTSINAYLNANGKFDLFYYTMITFTTIGYGDILPNIFLAKLVSILISITSVVCISVFLSSILSHKEELSDN
ncbi:potassium channel family protein [Clostridium sp. B9]|uniref:potassium channel family protein n=1 Tax=Clostridium sp. B9 TaxID=3423224 RepID=UPI003D2EE4F5